MNQVGSSSFSRPLDAAFLQQECAERELPWQVRVADEIPSTSDALRTLAQQGGSHGHVLFAESQTAGRGRRENRWLAPRGMDLMFSLLLRPAEPMMLWPRLTTLAALAICRAVEAELPLSPEIKWPNDVYLHGKKVSGLLAEAVNTPTGMAMVIGIGLNVNSRDFLGDLATTATSLSQALPAGILVRDLDRQQLAIRLLAELNTQFQRLDAGFTEAVAEVRARSWLLNKPIRATVDGVEIYGRAMDLSPEGHLILALTDGSLRTLASADSVRQVVSG